MIFSSSCLAIGTFISSNPMYSIEGNGMRMDYCLRNQDYRTASFCKADEEKQHFYGSSGV